MRSNRPRLTALNLRVLRDIEAKMLGAADCVAGAPAVPQPALDRRERYHAQRLSAHGRLRRFATDAPWFARPTVLYGAPAEPPATESAADEAPADDPRSVVREPDPAVRTWRSRARSSRRAR